MLKAIAKGVTPYYFIQYTVIEGEIVILQGSKNYPIDRRNHPNMIWGDVTAELREDKEVIAAFEKNGVNHAKAKEIQEMWQMDSNNDFKELKSRYETEYIISVK